MFEDAVTACKTAGNTDLWIKSHYRAGRSYAFIADQFGPGWEARGATAPIGGERAFGWALGFVDNELMAVSPGDAAGRRI